MELARHNEAEERKESQAEWVAFSVLFLSCSRARFFFVLSFCRFFFSSAASGAPTERGRRRHKMRHDCIVMLSDCANAQFGAQVRVIHQTFISSTSPSSHDAFYGEKQSDANVRFVVPQRRDDGGLMILASRA